MSRHFYAKVRVPLSAGWVQLEADVPDLDALGAEELAVTLGVLRQFLDFAEPVDDAEVEEVDEVVDAPEGRPLPPFPIERVPCPDCGREFVPSGLGVHRARAHPVVERPDPTRVVREDDDAKRCAEDGCDTVLSRFNKGAYCSLHESEHAPRHFGRTT